MTGTLSHTHRDHDNLQAIELYRCARCSAITAGPAGMEVIRCDACRIDGEAPEIRRRSGVSLLTLVALAAVALVLLAVWCLS